MLLIEPRQLLGRERELTGIQVFLEPLLGTGRNERNDSWCVRHKPGNDNLIGCCAGFTGNLPQNSYLRVEFCAIIGIRLTGFRNLRHLPCIESIHQDRVGNDCDMVGMFGCIIQQIQADRRMAVRECFDIAFGRR